MAVKVVSTEPDPSVVKYAVCRNCGVRLEYLPMERTSAAVPTATSGSTVLNAASK
jgi:hypothetical protein